MSVGTGTAVAIGLGAAAVGTVAGAAIGAHAQGQAADAQLTAAQQQVQLAREALQAQIKARQEGISEIEKVSAISPGEIKSIDDMLAKQGASLSASLSSIQKQQSALDAVDPSVKASWQNLYDLLTGKAADILKPLQTQLNQQRSQLVNQLSSQMGPGFMTSSAGIMALTQFDNQAAMTLNTAQMNAIQTVGQQFQGLSGLQQQGEGAITQNTLSAYQQALGADTTTLQAYENVVQRQTQGVAQAMYANPLAPGMVPNAQGQVVSAAGPAAAGGAPIISNALAGVGGLGTTVAGQAYGSANMGQLIAGIQANPGTTATTMPMVPSVPNLSYSSPLFNNGGSYSGNFGAMIATP